VRCVIIAFADQDIAHNIKTRLIHDGLPVRGSCSTGSQILQLAALCEDGGVIICPVRLPDMMAQEVMSLLPDTFDLLVLLTPRQQGMISGPGIFTLIQPTSSQVADGARQLLETRQMRAAMALVLKPVHRPDNLPSDQYKPAATASGHGRTAEEQKIIEQAKFLLMNRKKMTEAEAHRHLQRKSMESGIPLLELAHRLLSPN
jgi:two-component system, response regulator PdtaR